MTARAAQPYSPDELAATLERLDAPATLVVALSGGADSAALLVAATRLPPGSRRVIQALHVDHGLPGSPPLRAAAVAAAHALGVSLTIDTVQIKSREELGLEAAARAARYQAFAAHASPTRAVLTAHHQEDQAETLLLQLLRGAGARGLSAMPAAARLGDGRLLRPLLTVPRAALRALAEATDIPWCEDPSNADPAIDRNYLRQAVWPLIVARWPAAARTMARAAGHLAETVELLDSDLADVLTEVEVDGQLDLARLAALPPPQRRELIRYWLRQGGYPLPPARRLAQFDAQFLRSGEDRQPILAYADVELRRHDGRLVVMPPLPTLQLPESAALPAPGAVVLAGLGTLLVSCGSGLPLRPREAGYRLAQRHGGERWQPSAAAPVRPLKDWLREQRIPCWQRDRVILLYAADHLAAVLLPGRLWVCDADRAPLTTPGIGLEWTGAPPAMTLSVNNR
jgi:tRNA(Ile)-lysidine synthase